MSNTRSPKKEKETLEEFKANRKENLKNELSQANEDSKHAESVRHDAQLKKNKTSEEMQLIYDATSSAKMKIEQLEQALLDLENPQKLNKLYQEKIENEEKELSRQLENDAREINRGPDTLSQIIGHLDTERARLIEKYNIIFEKAEFSLKSGPSVHTQSKRTKGLNAVKDISTAIDNIQTNKENMTKADALKVLVDLQKKTTEASAGRTMAKGFLGTGVGQRSPTETSQHIDEVCNTLKKETEWTVPAAASSPKPTRNGGP